MPLFIWFSFKYTANPNFIVLRVPFLLLSVSCHDLVLCNCLSFLYLMNLSYSDDFKYTHYTLLSYHDLCKTFPSDLCYVSVHRYMKYFCFQR
jgi:hypothetical protein